MYLTTMYIRLSVNFSEQADHVIIHVNYGYLVKMYTHVYYPLGPNVVYN